MRIEPEKRLTKVDKNPDVLHISKAVTVESGNLTLTTGSLVQTVANAAFTDPGDGNTITLTSGAVHNIVVVTTAGGGETRVMGIPQFIGQECAIHHGTDGGDFAMTNASGWKGGTTSDDVATFSEVEDVMIIKACGLDAVDWRWIADVGVVIA